MKIVIDIPNEEYERVIAGKWEGNPLADYIENGEPYEARPTGEWIPVIERLPDNETEVLICNMNGDVEIAKGSYSTEIADEFIWYTSGWRFGTVIAWMPLPEPYKEAEE